MPTISFTVYGVAQPKGSKKSIPLYDKSAGKYRTRPNGAPMTVVVDDNPKAKSWMQEVKAAAYCAMRGAELTAIIRGPIQLICLFTVTRPGGHFSKATGKLLKSAPQYPATRPDTTKLIRGVEDALNGLLWEDDSRIVIQKAAKVYGPIAKTEIQVSTLDAGATPEQLDYETKPEVNAAA
jgi:Holliday junction resolvase RusA-like endonuclease